MPGMMETLKARLRKEEGLRLKPYLCSEGKLTIGYGRNIQTAGISIEEAETMLENDVSKVLKQLDNRVPWWRNLSENRMIVLADMTFNLGIEGICKFKKMLSHAQEGRFDSAAAEMRNSLWAKQVGRRSEELAEMMRKG